MRGPTSPAGDSGLKRASGDCLPDFAGVLLRWISPRIFEEKLASIINSVGADQAFLPPMPDRVYAVATLRGIPLSEEGIHRFQVQLRGQPVVSLDVPVLSCAAST